MNRLDARPRLAKKARVRFDRVREKHVLLAPERGLELNASGRFIVERCDGNTSARSIASDLAASSPDVERATIEADVIAFLDDLAARNLLADWPRDG